MRAGFDVVLGLRELGHEVQMLGMQDDLQPIRDAVTELPTSARFSMGPSTRWIACFTDRRAGWTAWSRQLRCAQVAKRTSLTRFDLVGYERPHREKFANQHSARLRRYDWTSPSVNKPILDRLAGKLQQGVVDE